MSPSGHPTIISNKQKQQGGKGKKEVHKRQLNFQAFMKQIEDQKRQHLTKVTYYPCKAKAQAVPAAWRCKAAHTEAPASIKTRSLLIAVKSLCHFIMQKAPDTTITEIFRVKPKCFRNCLLNMSSHSQYFQQVPMLNRSHALCNLVYLIKVRESSLIPVISKTSSAPFTFRTAVRKIGL